MSQIAVMKLSHQKSPLGRKKLSKELSFSLENHSVRMWQRTFLYSTSVFLRRSCFAALLLTTAVFKVQNDQQDANRQQVNILSLKNTPYQGLLDLLPVTFSIAWAAGSQLSRLSFHQEILLDKVFKHFSLENTLFSTLTRLGSLLTVIEILRQLIFLSVSCSPLDKSFCTRSPHKPSQSSVTKRMAVILTVMVRPVTDSHNYSNHALISTLNESRYSWKHR